ncbi:MAG: hypothetical protein SVR81_11325, partial [Chloroflexota bacterium]|nr:hypothetical protein [Chloroflexota bacterium]
MLEGLVCVAGVVRLRLEKGGDGLVLDWINILHLDLPCRIGGYNSFYPDMDPNESDYNRGEGMRSDQNNTAQSLDLLLLDPALTAEETRTGCEQAVQMHLASVVVKPCFVRQAAAALRGSDVMLGTVIGYPHGANVGRIKLYEARWALTEGAV